MRLRFTPRGSSRLTAGFAALLTLAVWNAAAFEPKSGADDLAAFEFALPELYLSSSNVPLAEVLGELPNRAAWQEFEAARANLGAPSAAVWIDPRSGAATNLMAPLPLIPGTGVGNHITLTELSAKLGYAVRGVDPKAVGDAMTAFTRQHQALFGIEMSQLGAPKAVAVSADLWQVSFPQTYHGIPVRWGRFAATVSHGNVVVSGTETWGNVRDLSPLARISSDRALEVGFGHLGGRLSTDRLVQAPTLEVIPLAPKEHQAGEGFAGPIGAGYGHRLAWVFAFVRPNAQGTWEAMVDAHSGELMAFQDTDQYADRQITGGVYPLTNTGVCPNNQTCGTMQNGWPMPFADTGLASPNNFTDSAGIFNYTSGTVTTTLTGRYVDIVDNCGAVSNSSATGDLNLGGSNNQHDCTTGGGSAGNTASARSAFYELNKIAEMARGWLPTNTWLQSRLTTNVNIQNTCNATWGGGQVNFYRSGGGCRNTGEIAGVFDHEWGHGMDDNDAIGSLSNSSEGYADIAAIFRLQTSCVGHGFYQTTNKGCGQTADGTGFNQNEHQNGGSHCDLNCSGVRDADWDQHADHNPDTPANFVCSACLTGSGPCGRQVHCAAAPQRQAAWDLVARDLTSAPFNLDSQTAFLTGNRIFYLGSGNIGSWYTCTCPSTSGGCGLTNAYLQWLAADDDNGNVNDGTPHITALRAAFNRHGIGCATPTAGNSGCAGGPTTPPTLTATPGDSQVSLSWNAVAGASRYWVLRSEGHAGCNFGKTRIADITGTSFVDTAVANGRQYFYNVVAQGTSSACFTQVSNCANVTPAAVTTPDFTLACSPTSLNVAQGASGTSTCTVTSVNGFNSAVALSCSGLPAGASCSFAPASVTPPSGGSATSTATVSVTTTAFGTYPFSITGVSGSLSKTQAMSLTVPAPGPVTLFFDNFETALGWTTNPNATDTATTGAWERGDPETTTSSGTKQLGTTVSGTNDLVTGRLAGTSAGAFDLDGGVSSIQSPAITLPASGTLTLAFSYYLAHGTNSSTADFLRVFVVGTTTSQVFEELGAANNDDAVWAAGTASLNAFAGQTVKIRIEAADASTASLVEAAIDDVRVTQQ